MLETPKDIITTTESEMINVICLKKLYIGMQLIMGYGRAIVNHKLIKGCVKWAISSKACSRAIIRRVEFVNKKKVLKNLGLITVEEQSIEGTTAMNASDNGIGTIVIKILRLIGSDEGIKRGSTEKNTMLHITQQTGNSRNSIAKEIGTLSTRHTAINAHVAEKQIQNSLLSTTFTVMDTLNVRKNIVQVAPRFIVILLNKIFRLNTKFFAIIATLVAREMAGYALIKNVQRLLREQVHPSGWKRLLPVRRNMGNKIVPSAQKCVAAI